MNEKVIGLRGEFVPLENLSERATVVLHELEKAIAAARSGDYEAIGIVMVARVGHLEVDTYRSWSTGATAPPTRLVAGLDLLKCDIAGGVQ